jgi:hypothetical protein
MIRLVPIRIVLAQLAILAVTVLALGAAAHFEHHLIGPDCDSGHAPTSHPCASCSVLHGGTLAEVGVAAAAPIASRPGEHSPRGILAPVTPALASCAPRAPPLG